MNGRIVRAARRSNAEAAISLAQRREWFVDVSQTAANVLFGSNAKSRKIKAGEALTIGMPLYIKASDGRAYKTDADASLEAGTLAGWAGQTVPAAGQMLDLVIEDDDFTPGFTMTKNGVYVPSATAGGIAPVADVTTGWYGMWGIFAKSTSKARLYTFNSGVAV